MKKNNRCALFMAFSLLAVHSANAANSFYTAGDLVLYFQKPGDVDTIYANLGNTAGFRGANAGSTDGTNQLNILDLGTTLEAAFGVDWAIDPTVFAGLAGVWGTSGTNSTLQNGDPHRTLYVSSPRNGVGETGTANSSGWDLTIAGNSAITSGAQGIFTQNNAFEVNYDSLVTVSLTSVSTIDNQNPFFAGTNQSPAFNGAFDGGVQQQGSATSFASFPYGGSGTVEFALDLYRILGRNDVTNQVAGDVRVGSYEGTVTVGTNGMVSFIAVPEPSSLALVGLAAGSLVLRRRRSIK
jgi:PEP-CTERM motif